MPNTRRLTPTLKSVLDVFFRVIQSEYPSVRWTITSGFRSSSEQAALYRTAARRGLPAAPPGRSKHERGRAVDIVFNPREFETTAGEIWEALGGRWGGRFKAYDPVHFEDPWPL